MNYFKLIRDILIIFALAIGFRILFYDPYNIPSSSMYPNLLIGDRIFVSKYPYGYNKNSNPLQFLRFSVGDANERVLYSKPEYGDVIVFKAPHEDKDYTKRIIAMEGDKVQTINGVLHINDEPVKMEKLGTVEIKNPIDGSIQKAIKYKETLPNGKSYEILDSGESQLDNSGPFTVGEGEFFTMGDNRDYSSDSRVWGIIKPENLIGRVEVIFLSTTSHPLKFWKMPESVRGDRFFKKVE